MLPRRRVVPLLCLALFANASCARPGSRQTAAALPDRSYFEEGRASYYSRRLEGRPTAFGERYDPDAMTAAHRTLPRGTLVEVRRRGTNLLVVVRINDRGPFVAGRVIDLSRRAASELGMLRDGTVEVELRVVRPAE